MASGQVAVVFHPPANSDDYAHRDHKAHYGMSGATIFDTVSKVSLTTCNAANYVVEDVTVTPDSVEGEMESYSQSITITVYYDNNSYEDVPWASADSTDWDVAYAYVSPDYIFFLNPGTA